MTLTFYTLGVIYLVYSFLGWVAETVVATIRGGRFANRGAAAGPFCFIYGTTGVLLAVSFSDLRTEPVYLFFACMMAATVMERLCVPAVFAAVGCAGHGKCAVGQ